MIRLTAYLKQMDVPFEVFLYAEPWVCSPSELALSLGIPAEIMSEVIVLKAEDNLLMAVLPAKWLIDLERMEEILHTREVRLATEEEIRRRFPTCEIGSIPPFGKLYNLRVFFDSALMENEDIAFQAGNRRQVVKMRIRDLARLVCPCLGDFHLRPLRMASRY